MMLFRSIGLLETDLTRVKNQGLSISSDGFLSRAFEQNISAADTAYNSVFIEGIKNGSLDPQRYGAVNVLDAYYCYEAASSLWIACSKAKNKDQGLYELLTRLYNGYAGYNQTFLNQWHISASKNVTPTICFREYAEHERKVAKDEDAVYLLPALLPCYYLWYWMAQKIKQDSTLKPGLYQFWVDGNAYEPHSAEAIDDFISQWSSAGKTWDESKAMEIFKTSITLEGKVFNECGY